MTVPAPLGARGDEDVLESGQGRPLGPVTSGTAESWQRRSRKAKINLDKRNRQRISKENYVVLKSWNRVFYISDA